MLPLASSLGSLRDLSWCTWAANGAGRASLVNRLQAELSDRRTGALWPHFSLSERHVVGMPAETTT